MHRRGQRRPRESRFDCIALCRIGPFQSQDAYLSMAIDFRHSHVMQIRIEGRISTARYLDIIGDRARSAQRGDIFDIANHGDIATPVEISFQLGIGRSFRYRKYQIIVGRQQSIQVLAKHRRDSLCSRETDNQGWRLIVAFQSRSDAVFNRINGIRLSRFAFRTWADISLSNCRMNALRFLEKTMRVIRKAFCRGPFWYSAPSRTRTHDMKQNPRYGHTSWPDIDPGACVNPVMR